MYQNRHGMNFLTLQLYKIKQYFISRNLEKKLTQEYREIIRHQNSNIAGV